jgi:hypothetical protein
VLAADRVTSRKQVGDAISPTGRNGTLLLRARATTSTSASSWPKNPYKKGLLTVAPLGNGTWTYVGLGLWRQLPAGTPGAYRLLANLISRPRNDAAAPSVQQ